MSDNHKLPTVRDYLERTFTPMEVTRSTGSYTVRVGLRHGTSGKLSGRGSLRHYTCTACWESWSLPVKFDGSKVTCPWESKHNK